MRQLIVFFIFVFATNAFAISAKRLITLEWEEVPGAASYEIELTPNKGKALRFQSKTAEWSGEVRIGKYQLRVRGLDNRGAKGDWSEAQGLFVQLLPPEAIAPKNKTQINTNENQTADVQFVWQKLKEADSYQLEIFNFKTQEKILTEITKDNSFKASLPVAAEYSWRVSALLPDSTPEDIEESTELNLFSLNGKKLEKPQIENPATKFVTELKWDKVPFAASYSYLLQRKSKNGSWQTIDKNPSFVDNVLAFDTKHPGGNYRMTIRAQAPMRPSSDVDKREFFVYEGNRSQQNIEKAMKREALEQEHTHVFILSYLISSLQYQSTNQESGQNASFNALGGSGRVGYGYFKPNAKWGFTAIAEMSGVIIEDKNKISNSLELAMVKRSYWNQVTQFRWYGGLFFRELPEAVGNGSNSIVKSVSFMGPHAGFQIWHPFNSKYGIQLNGQVLQGLVKSSTPNNKDLEPGDSTSMQLGLLGSKKIKDNVIGFLGYAYRVDKVSYKSAVFDGSDLNNFNQSGAPNTVKMTGHYLNLYMEIGF